MILQILILVVLLRILIMTERPFLCSGIYTALAFITCLASGNPFETVLIASISTFVLSSLYFLLLDRSKGIMWWIILIIGIFLATGSWQLVPRLISF